jgi:hypothetical protein
VCATLVLTSSSSAWGQTPTASPAPAEIPAAEPATDPAAAAADTSPQPAADGDRGWAFSLSVPIWLVGVNGDLVVRGADLDADQDAADDVDEFLDSELNGAFALHFEAEKQRFGMLFDAMYLDRSAQGTVDVTDAEGSLKGFIGEVGAFYTLVPPAPEKRGWGMFRLDALGGVRVSALELGVETGGFDADVSRTFYDPFVGARAEVGLTDWLSLKFRGDVGGFGIDAWNTSDFAYNVDTAFEFHLARWFDLGVGYRWLNYDLELGSDSSLDATLSGPIVELKFNF